MTDRHLVHLVVGPAQHGVCIFAEQLAALMGAPVIRVGNCEDAPVGRLPSWGATHLQYTDVLFGSDTARAAAAFERLCDRLRGNGSRVTVTLHDLPDPGDDPGRWHRRAAGYARVVAAVDHVLVCSEHERDRLDRVLAPGGAQAPVEVIPLPVSPAPALTPPAERPPPRHEVAIFGFVYPGKGHEEVLAALPPSAPRLPLVALGRAADGHEDLLARLTAAAAQAGRTLRVEGFLPEARVRQRLQQAAVPVAPARSVSASGSINAWLQAGRRPVVVDNPYTREFDARYPGALRICQVEDLPEVIAATLRDPGLSWLTRPVPPELSGAAVARAHHRVLSPPFPR